MTKFVLASDLHGDLNTAGYPRFGDVQEALYDVADYAVEHKADCVIIAGDILTNDPSLDLYIKNICLCRDIANYLSDEKIPSIWMTGNHDIFKSDDCITALDPLENIDRENIDVMIKVIKRPSYFDHMVFLPFTYKDYDLDKVCEEIARDHGGDKVKLVVGHLNIEGITPGSEVTDFPRGRNVFFPVETVKKCFPNAILCNGHIHKRSFFKGINIIGSLLNLTRGEVDNKPGFLVIDV